MNPEIEERIASIIQQANNLRSHDALNDPEVAEATLESLREIDDNLDSVTYMLDDWEA